MTRLHWNATMTKSAHSDFFGLDLGVGYAPTVDHMLAVPNDVFERAEAALQKWAHVTPCPAKTNVATAVLPTSTSTPTYGTTPSRTAMAPPTATAATDTVPPSLADMHPNPNPNPNPSPPSANTVTVSAASTAQNPDLAPAAPPISTAHAKKRSSPSSPPPPSPSPSPSALGPSNSKIQKTFHFVANNDKRTAARIRNTMTSRNLRQSKVSRIAELERELERQRGESELWRVRAVRAGWKDGERLGL
ncbi:hypothetical protein LTR70_001820 [Exophiala xenobiotica]|uniref:BZIP domain-containing protein n=1 Tax=Lithohypha guttulata TaxID=1690604 RepID=A0ABR0KLU3_9EURO|nr:hypothetical protein LTR24_000986 [Lithohypha guttulata]KAK5327078.1 hypothetical protein LTR70_001820 [Exophiala xenobiotica]